MSMFIAAGYPTDTFTKQIETTSSSQVRTAVTRRSLGKELNSLISDFTHSEGLGSEFALERLPVFYDHLKTFAEANGADVWSSFFKIITSFRLSEDDKYYFIFFFERMCDQGLISKHKKDLLIKRYYLKVLHDDSFLQ